MQIPMSAGLLSVNVTLFSRVMTKSFSKILSDIAWFGFQF